MNSFINNPIINKTGLACAIWNDTQPEILRKRLDQKTERSTLLPEEKKALLKQIEDLYLKAKSELSPE